MSDNQEALLRRARALHETAKRGGSEQEMLVAAEKLASLVARYNLDLSKIVTDQQSVCMVKDVPGKYNETWRQSCYAAAASLFFSNYFYRAVGGKNVGIIHCIIGEEHNVEVAAEMGAFFEDTINRLANEASRQNKDLTVEHTSRHRFIRTFRLAAARRLQTRVDEHVNRAKQGKLVDPESNVTLPALRGLYDHQDDLYAAFLLANGIAPKARENRDQMLSRRGRALGTQAGDSISFTTQINEGGAASKFILPRS